MGSYDEGEIESAEVAILERKEHGKQKNKKRKKREKLED